MGGRGEAHPKGDRRALRGKRASEMGAKQVGLSLGPSLMKQASSRIQGGRNLILQRRKMRCQERKGLGQRGS